MDHLHDPENQASGNGSSKYSRLNYKYKNSWGTIEARVFPAAHTAAERACYVTWLVNLANSWLDNILGTETEKMIAPHIPELVQVTEDSFYIAYNGDYPDFDGIETDEFRLETGDRQVRVFQMEPNEPLITRDEATIARANTTTIEDMEDMEDLVLRLARAPGPIGFHSALPSGYTINRNNNAD